MPLERAAGRPRLARGLGFITVIPTAAASREVCSARAEAQRALGRTRGCGACGNARIRGCVGSFGRRRVRSDVRIRLLA